MTLDDLTQTFANLRQAWRSDWPGLPQVVQACLSQLGFHGQHLPVRFQHIHACLQTLSVLMEQEGRALADQHQEPPYHNRLHTADTLVALTTLLLQSRGFEKSKRLAQTPSAREWIGLLAMLGHDFRHPGQINRFTHDIESASVAHLRPIMNQCGVSRSDQQSIATLILFTDPTQVAALHQKWREQGHFDLANLECLAILLEEADILASCLPSSGPALGESLKQEWLRIPFAAAHSVATAAGRRGFLTAARFSSPASLSLAIPQSVAEQLNLNAEVQRT